METKTVTKKNFLISEVKAKIRNSFEKWYVGTSEVDNVWRRNKAEIIVFNVLDCKATLAAYEYLVNAGMIGRKPLGKEPNYLYLYRNDGVLPDCFIYNDPGYQS